MNTRRWIVPAAAGLLLTLQLLIGGISLRRPPGLDDYFARVRQAVHAIPWRIAGWDGEDIPPPRGARRLLRPNVIFQRQYVMDDGRTVAVLIVHCGNVRDMEGHYPPNCYPGQGWNVTNSAERVIETGVRDLPAVDYTFSREDDGIARSLVVTDFFVLPNTREPIHARIDALQTASRSPSASGLGSAQFQFVSSDPFTAEEWNGVLEIFSTELLSVIEEIGEGVNAQ